MKDFEALQIELAATVKKFGLDKKCNMPDAVVANAVITFIGTLSKATQDTIGLGWLEAKN